jgi:GT2 family glycosyltransferase
VNRKPGRSKPLISVIIPCYGNVRALIRLLGILENQSVPPEQYEVIVVDDGNQPRLSAGCPEYRNTRIIRLNKRSGPAAARNAAMPRAHGHFVLFLNADAVPSASLLQDHLAGLRSGNVRGVLGRFDLLHHPDDLFSRLLEFGDFIFRYRALREDAGILPGNFFWTCNLSIRKSAVTRAGNFDASFPYPMQEDVDLGYRLWKQGIGVQYHPEIVCGHDHPMNYWGLVERYRLMGREWVRLARKHGPAMNFEILGKPFEVDNNLGRDILAHMDRLDLELYDGARQFQQSMDALRDLMDRSSDPEAVFQDRAPSLVSLLQQILRREWLRGAAGAIAGIPFHTAGGITTTISRKQKILTASQRKRLLQRSVCWSRRTDELMQRTGVPLQDCILQNHSELEAFCHWISRNRIRSFLEIGSWTGRLASLLSKLFSFRLTAACDRLLAYRAGLPLHFPPEADVFVGSSHSIEFERWREKLGHVDLVFIDGDHSYEGVRKDFEIQRKYPHKFLAFHDITGGRPASEGVGRFWRELCEGKRREICFPDPQLGETESRMGIGIWRLG